VDHAYEAAVEKLPRVAGRLEREVAELEREVASLRSQVTIARGARKTALPDAPDAMPLRAIAGGRG